MLRHKQAELSSANKKREILQRQDNWQTENERVFFGERHKDGCDMSKVLIGTRNIAIIQKKEKNN